MLDVVGSLDTGIVLSHVQARVFPGFEELCMSSLVSLSDIVVGSVTSLVWRDCASPSLFEDALCESFAATTMGAAVWAW